MPLKTRLGIFRTIRIRYLRRSTSKVQIIPSRIQPNIKVKEEKSALMQIKLLITILALRINKICLSKTKVSSKLGTNNRPAATLHKIFSQSITR
jgi:hypothetical protein